MQKNLVKSAFTATIPVLTGYIVLGIGFGILLKTAGYGTLWALVMSIFIYAGSMQYIAVTLISGGASLITVALTTLLVNARHLFYGISMVDTYSNAGKIKPYLIHALTDETYSLVCQRREDMSEKEFTKYCFFVSIFDHCYWICGCVLGTVIGSLLTFNTEGIDFVLTALFVTIFTDQWLKSKNHFAAISGLIISVICLLIFGKDSFLIPSMIAIAATLILGRKFTGEDKIDG